MLHRLRDHIEATITLSDAEWEGITTCFTLQKFSKKEYVIRENQVHVALYFVAGGILKSGFLDPSGKEHIIQFATEDWWISDFQAFFRQVPATLSIQCLQEATLYRIRLRDFENLCRNFPKVEHFFRLKANNGYIALQQRILSLMTESPKDKYERFLQSYPLLSQQLSKTLIAHYIGVSRETLSRLYGE